MLNRSRSNYWLPECCALVSECFLTSYGFGLGWLLSRFEPLVYLSQSFVLPGQCSSNPPLLSQLVLELDSDPDVLHITVTFSQRLFALGVHITKKVVQTAFVLGYEILKSQKMVESDAQHITSVSTPFTIYCMSPSFHSGFGSSMYVMHLNHTVQL